MPDPTLVSQSYGKSQVRLSHVFRDGSRHEIHQWTIAIALEGEFASAYTEADCSQVVATDTMKNTVYILAERHAVRSMEEFARLLASHFLKQYAHVASCTIRCQGQPWTRIELTSRPHDHAFLGATTERLDCEVVGRAGGQMSLRSGLSGLKVLKTTGSAFRGFLRDEYTTLPDASDRILATTLDASWPCAQLDADWTAVRQTIRAAVLEVFANHHSESVQHTLYEMARGAFAACPLIDEISIHMPNEHHLLANLAPFGLANPGETFVPTLEPFGDIRATMRRGGGESASIESL